VPTATGRRLTRNEFINVEDANHMEVCQPVNEDHISYRNLQKPYWKSQFEKKLG
jgi:hypothetical protein